MDQSQVFQTLADPARLRIVEALRHGELQVNDVVAKLDIHQSGVSRHLRILRDSGFVEVRPDGQRRLYSLRAEPFEELDRWLLDFRKLWNARLDRFEQALAARRKSPTALRGKTRGQRGDSPQQQRKREKKS